MNLTFQNPAFLLVLLLAIPAVWSAWRFFRAMSLLRAIIAGLARAVLIALMAMALAGASAVQTTDRLAVVVVVDVSGSMRTFADAFAELAPGPGDAQPDLWGAIRGWIKGIGQGREENDLLGLVVFDGEALAVATPSPRDYSDYSLDYQIAGGSNIAQALQLAQAMFPPGARQRIVLISDGNATGADPVATARQLAAAGIRIDVIPIAYQVSNEVMVEAVDSPPRAASEATVNVRIVLNATDAAAGALNLLYEGRPLDLNGAAPGTGEPIELQAGRNVQVFQVPLREDRIVHRLEPVFTPANAGADQILTNNRAETFTITPGAGKVLLVDGVSGGRPGGAGAILAQTLAAAGIETQTVGPSRIPGDMLALQAYDLIMLQNVAVEDVPRQKQELLADYVQALGGGLVMIGGPDSFGAGGWNGSPLEPILPVELDLPDKVIAPTAAVAIVLDSSGSMMQPVLGGSRTQQEVANRSAAAAVETMDERDLLTIIEFNSSVNIIKPLSRNDNPEQAARMIRGIASGGGTNITPALRAAYQQLRGAEAPVKHVVLLSDGKDAMSAQLGPPLAAEMARAGITVSTIAIGDQADVSTLAALAEAGGGTFYRVIDPSTLVRIFLKEIRIIRRPMIKLGRFDPIPLGSGSPITTGISGWPELFGYVMTQARDDARVVNALATPDGHPLLSHWFAGRGQVAAFTSDAHYWARQWLDWPGYARLWTQLARTIARPSGQSNSRLETQIVGDELVIRLEASDAAGRPRDLLTVDGLLYQPDGESRDIRLEQVGPGVYEARVSANERGTYIVALTPSAGRRPLPVVVGGATRATSGEFQRLRSNIGLMEEIAAAADGRILDLRQPSTAAVFDRSGMQPLQAVSPLWPTLLVWSLVIFLFDVGTRRIAWDRLIGTRELAVAGEQVHDAAVRQAGQAVRRVRTAAAGGAGGGGGSGGGVAAGSAAARAAEVEDVRGREERDPRDIEAERRREQRQQQEAAARRERQQLLRKQMLERLAGGAAGAGAADTEGPATSQEPPPRDPTTSGLIAAKRRAKDRFVEEQENKDNRGDGDT